MSSEGAEAAIPDEFFHTTATVWANAAVVLFKMSLLWAKYGLNQILRNMSFFGAFSTDINGHFGFKKLLELRSMMGTPRRIDSSGKPPCTAAHSWCAEGEIYSLCLVLVACICTCHATGEHHRSWATRDPHPTL